MINGGVKFFEQNYALFKSGATATASSNTTAAKFILDVNKYTIWESIGSNDLTTETITITLPSSKKISRILLGRFNFKNFSVKYNNGSGFLDFTNVVGVNNESKSGINETSYSYSSAYYEFDEVTANQIQITASTTQTANEQKFLNQLIVTEEIGTLEGFPRVKPRAVRNERKTKALSGKRVVQKSYETNQINITFKTHPYQNDVDIIEELFNREETFLVYPCGGRTGSNYFKVEQKSWKLDDVFNMQFTGNLKNEFEKGVYLLGFNKTIILEEHV